jgi:hypothetical protein
VRAEGRENRPEEERIDRRRNVESRRNREKYTCEYTAEGA